jgi:nuclear pore complex protein Nup155
VPFSLFIKGARILEFDKLREIVGDYQQLGFARGWVSLVLRNYRRNDFLGTVDLPLTCAQILDPDNVGAEFWASAALPNDPRSEFYERRLQCYDLVLDSLLAFEEKSKKSATSAVVDDLETVRSDAYELAFASDDEMFHSTLYDWLIGKGLADELLQVCFPVTDESFTDFC